MDKQREAHAFSRNHLVHMSLSAGEFCYSEKQVVDESRNVLGSSRSLIKA